MTESSGVDPSLTRVLESAARLQTLVPETVLVGGSAPAYDAGHRLSFDHDHVLEQLSQRFDLVLEALESEGEWVTNRVVYGKIILDRLGDIEAGVRQLIRRTPLEVTDVVLPSGATLRVPTIEETLRIKAFLAIRRNQVRDYLDIAALTQHLGAAAASTTLRAMDAFYADQDGGGDGVASQVARQLADPRPADAGVLGSLADYKGLDPRWHEWSAVVGVCRDVAEAMVDGGPS